MIVRVTKLECLCIEIQLWYPTYVLALHQMVYISRRKTRVICRYTKYQNHTQTGMVGQSCQFLVYTVHDLISTVFSRLNRWFLIHWHCLVISYVLAGYQLNFWVTGKYSSEQLFDRKWSILITIL